MADKWDAYEREDLNRELIPGMIQAEALTLIGLRLSDIAHSLDGLKNVGRSISSALTLKDCGPSEKADNLIDEMRNPAHAASWWRQVQKILSNLDSADEKHQRDLSAMKLQALAGSGPAPLQYGGNE
jgi:hypothetical protein